MNKEILISLSLLIGFSAQICAFDVISVFKTTGDLLAQPGTSFCDMSLYVAVASAVSLGFAGKRLKENGYCNSGVILDWLTYEDADGVTYVTLQGIGALVNRGCAPYGFIAAMAYPLVMQIVYRSCSTTSYEINQGIAAGFAALVIKNGIAWYLST